MLSVVLVEPITAGNVGAVARVMKNFGAKQLYLVKPKCNHLCKEAVDRAKHAKDLLKKAKVMSLADVRKKHHVLVATTARLGNHYNLVRIPITPQQLKEKIKPLHARTNVGIVFGRESDGLTTEEISECDITVTIPTSKAYSSLNLSHSVAIVLSHLFTTETDLSKKFIPLTQREKETILTVMNNILDGIDFGTATKRQTQKTLWKRLLGKSLLTKREGFAILGFLRRLKQR